jgi:4-oxalocrotonate tautomerase
LVDGKDQKIVAAEITESIARNTGTDARYIYVLFEDIMPSNWAVASNFLVPEGNSE